ncbi:MAG: hypothetical protein AAF436_02465 [Myxococcota bacterium]
MRVREFLCVASYFLAFCVLPYTAVFIGLAHLGLPDLLAAALSWGLLLAVALPGEGHARRLFRRWWFRLWRLEAE